jgi:hypothetical protein
LLIARLLFSVDISIIGRLNLSTTLCCWYTRFHAVKLMSITTMMMMIGLL